eukprot:TRINITY_DN4964_c0_g1_i1.p1 TRINITY_DN4964_c0_g1~~TRINITY_DN4964_c0_g1_i1.p1  ORF type:complete len:283 (+),score=42.68 TRINITY_DN4964_c0_g1_i1:83-931(+)
MLLCLGFRVTCLCIFFFFFNDTATTEIYTRSIVGSVRCVQETGINAEYMGQKNMEYPIEKIRGVNLVDVEPYSPSLFMLPEWAKQYVESVYIPNGMIKDRCVKLAEEIFLEYKDCTELTFIVVLSGSDCFFNNLLSTIQLLLSSSESKLRFNFEYVKVSSYSGTSSGKMSMGNLNVSNIEKKHTLIIEDIYDSGNSMEQMLNYLKTLKPLSLKTAVLLHKCNSVNLKYGFVSDFTGFIIKDKFVIGHHLDYNYKFRDLPHICIINAKGIEAFKKQPNYDLSF